MTQTNPSLAPVDSKRWDGLSPEVLLSTYETMVLIRRFEEQCGAAYMKAKIGGFLHLSIGEEAIAGAAALALRPSDYLISTYREHGHALAKGADPAACMAELFGREGGISKGRGGSMHLFDLEKRFMGGYGIVGGGIPLAAGFGFAARYQERDDAVLCFFGDGAMNQGVLGETLNMASLWKLPVVFFCINNQYGMGTAIAKASAVTDLWRRSEAFGVPGERIDGMDVMATYRAIRDRLEEARQGRPSFIEAVTYRYRGHSMSDADTRDKDEVAFWKGRDPITTFGESLIQSGYATHESTQLADERAGRRIEEAVAFANASPDPDPQDLTRYVYASQTQEEGR